MLCYLFSYTVNIASTAECLETILTAGAKSSHIQETDPETFDLSLQWSL